MTSKLDSLQKLGGASALLQATTFIMGFALYFSLLASAGGEGSLDLAEQQPLMHAWNLGIYLVFGLLLVVLALALHERLKHHTPAMAQAATAFGLIWAGLVMTGGLVDNTATDAVALAQGSGAHAAQARLALDFVANGLGGGNEIIGGLWVLLVSWAALRSGRLSRPLTWLGLAVSAIGLASLLPALRHAGPLFGLGLVVWFAWLGVAMWRGAPGREMA